MLSQDPTNDERAAWAAVGIAAFARVTDMDKAGEDTETIIGDFLTDLMHLCEHTGIDFDSKLDGARQNYEAEKEDEAAA
jgi:hypothetical protein